MAGIAGILGKSANKDTLSRMLDSIKHRGSDDIQLHNIGEIHAGICSAKLSIERGNGFALKDNIVVVIDGEIYNKREKNIPDAEYIILQYKKYGYGFAQYLRGAFACAVLDANELILARDCIGIRPLYWGKMKDGTLCFGSEMKSLVGLSDDVEEFPASSTMSSKYGMADYVPRLPEVPLFNDFVSARNALRNEIFYAVQRNLDDGAVGACFLSGGLDSSIIAAVAYELGAKLPLITVGVEGAPDIANARRMAEHLGGEHHINIFNPHDISKAVRDAVRILESYDEDCVSGAIANIFASAKAREFTKCALSGEGGDELFGGYHLLKDLDGEASRAAMMRRLIEIAHNTALQRLDRAMMANGIHYRTPFLDSHVVVFARHLPVQWKINPSEGGKLIEKYILREAFKDLLPESIYLREKLRFSGGAGTDLLMDTLVPVGIKFEESYKTATGTENFRPNSAKEIWYYDIFKQEYPAECFVNLVDRWDPFK